MPSSGTGPVELAQLSAILIVIDVSIESNNQLRHEPHVLISLLARQSEFRKRLNNNELCEIPKGLNATLVPAGLDRAGFAGKICLTNRRLVEDCESQGTPIMIVLPVVAGKRL